MTYPNIYQMSTGAGSDGLWFTGDDTSKYMLVRQYVDATHKRVVICSDFTGTITAYYTFTFDGSGRIIAYTYYNNNNDGIWFNGDDLESNVGAADT